MIELFEEHKLTAEETLRAEARVAWFAALPAERARRAAAWLSRWATAHGLEQEAQQVPAWDGVSSASKNASWRAFADAVIKLRRLARAAG